ncbi:hypothetical protein OAG71_02815, partial [bacterium]|nr:hypothetical protein [bacterium]
MTTFLIKFVITASTPTKWQLTNIKNGLMPSTNQNFRITIVNRNYPPRTGVTGESACRLAEYLETNHGAVVTVVSSRSNYEGGGSPLEPTGEVRLIKSWYDGKNKLLRLFSSFFESYYLVKAARSAKPDRVIVMTDPPFLQFWAANLLAGKCPWTLWSMDIFPDAFVASDLVTSRNPFYRLLKHLTYR